MDTTTDDRENLRRDLAAKLNEHSRENASNTPDFILAAFLTDALAAFDAAIAARAAWHTSATAAPPEFPEMPDVPEASQTDFERMLRTRAHIAATYLERYTRQAANAGKAGNWYQAANMARKAAQSRRDLDQARELLAYLHRHDYERAHGYPCTVEFPWGTEPTHPADLPDEDDE